MLMFKLADEHPLTKAGLRCMGWALCVWGYAVAWFLVTDPVKLLAYRLLDPVKAAPRPVAKAEPRPEAKAALQPRPSQA